MTRPAVYDFEFDRNVTKNVDFALKNEDGSAFDLTGYTVTADAVGAILPGGVLELSPTITGTATGIINVTLSKTATGLLVSTEGLKPSEIPKWDMLIDLSGITTKVMTGSVYIYETQTT